MEHGNVIDVKTVMKIAKKSDYNQFPTSNRLVTAVKGCNAAVGVGPLCLILPKPSKLWRR